MEIVCPQCGKKADKRTGCVKRARSIGAPVYCGRKCAGLARRVKRTIDEKRKDKAIYDELYRAKNRDRLKKSKAEYFQKVYKENPEKFRLQRISRRQYNKDFKRTPEYRKYKHEYDKKYRAKKEYGEFWESFILLRNIENQIPNREVMQQNNLHNKTQKRKRNYEKFKREELERNTLGMPK